jgi:hypothetical protein
VNGSAPPLHNSRCVSSGKWPNEMPLARAPLTAQPVDAQPAEITSAISRATTTSYSKPPNSLGRVVRSNSASRILAMISGEIVRLRSVSSANPRISGTISRARAISSSGLGGSHAADGSTRHRPLRSSLVRNQDALGAKREQRQTAAARAIRYRGRAISDRVASARTAPHPSLSPLGGRGLRRVGEAKPSLTRS